MSISSALSRWYWRAVQWVRKNNSRSHSYKTFMFHGISELVLLIFSRCISVSQRVAECQSVQLCGQLYILSHGLAGYLLHLRCLLHVFAGQWLVYLHHIKFCNYSLVTFGWFFLHLQHTLHFKAHMFGVEQGKLLKRQKWAYFRNKWNLLDMAIIILSWSSLSLFIQKTVQGNIDIQYYQKHKNQ